METKQTAVTELLIWIKERNDICKRDFSYGSCDYYTIRILEIIEDKVNSMIAMEKEHIGRAYQEGLIDGMNHSPKEYYNETYGK